VQIRRRLYVWLAPAAGLLEIDSHVAPETPVAFLAGPTAALLR
jgi:hypothetical protein